MISYRYASAADVDRFYGERPEQTIQAIVICVDDEPKAIVGLDRRKDRYIAFSEYKPEFEPYLKSMTTLRALKAAERMFHSAPLPVIVQNTSNPTLLERLGFIEIQPGVHLCHS